MYSRVSSGAIDGLNCRFIQVEVDVSSGLPCFEMVGLPGSEVKEAKERVRVALRNTGVSLPPKKITVNLSPANIRKEGSGFDLPIAIGILVSMEEICPIEEKKMIAVGELGLNGELKPVKGILPTVREAKKEGFSYCMVPWANREEAELIPGIKIIAMENLSEVVQFLKDDKVRWDENYKKLFPERKNIVTKRRVKESEKIDQVDYGDIYGQDVAKRCAVIATAGFHHLLMVGPPGAGKSMIAKRIPTITPEMTLDESLEVSTIYSIMGKLGEGCGLINKRPFQSPHHTITERALVGGGMFPKPGVISLCHKGVLFLDEFAEFKRTTLDLLREPLEEKKIHVSRRGGEYEYPSDFMLVAAMNPCPCGFYPDRNKCRCSEPQIKRYLSSISGPILDRIDICLEVQEDNWLERKEDAVSLSSLQMRKQVEKARKLQKIRFKSTAYEFNSQLSGKDVERFCELGTEERKYLDKAYRSLGLSVRGYLKVLKLSRTIADVDGEKKIRTPHLSEALCYYSGMDRFVKG